MSGIERLTISIYNISSVSEQLELAEALLLCDYMKEESKRDIVVGVLSSRISDNIIRSKANKVDVLRIVQACLNYPDGLKELLERVSYFEEGSLPFLAFDDLIDDIFMSGDITYEQRRILARRVPTDAAPVPADLRRLYAESVYASPPLPALSDENLTLARVLRR